MYKSKYLKTNLRNPKYNNPNPRDSDQRERELRGREKAHLTSAAWGSRSLGRAQWWSNWVVHGGLKSIFSLFLFMVFFFPLGSSLMFWWFLVYKG